MPERRVSPAGHPAHDGSFTQLLGLRLLRARVNGHRAKSTPGQARHVDLNPACIARPVIYDICRVNDSLDKA
jgi:hypothetical protein